MKLVTRWRLLRERASSSVRALSPEKLVGRLRRLRFRGWFRRLRRVPVERDASAEALQGWVPIVLELAEDFAGWVPAAKLHFRRGLFYETLFEALTGSRPVPARRTDLATLRSLGSVLDREPDGFIFHVSRCGSTLLGNMLLASQRNLVIQEAESVNSVLRDFAGHVPEVDKAAALRGVLAAFRRQLPPDGRLYVKFSSWNVLQLPLVRAAFPGVPCVFVYRDPVEVVVSNLLKPGTWVRDQHNQEMGRYLVDAEPEVVGRMDRAEYCARVIGRYGRSALQQSDAGLLFVNYSQLSEACFRALLDFFRSRVSEEEFATMAGEMSFYSKGSATRAHREDRKKKQGLAGLDVHEIVARHAGEAYEQLESRRIVL